MHLAGIKMDVESTSTNTDGATDPFETLPCELLRMILSFLSFGTLMCQVSLVSKRFRAACEDPSICTLALLLLAWPLISWLISKARAR